MSKVELIHGDCMEAIAKMKDNFIDAIVTDPPYGLSFMGKKWDYDVPSVEIWKECLRILKPGGHLLSFGGSRTYHRMAVNIEDAGFDIRDMIAWVYGSGFPKSLNIGKAVDKLQGNEREVLGTKYDLLNIGSKPGTVGDKHEGYQRPWNANPEAAAYMVSKGTSEWEGWGTALKPALEPITVARKPIEGTVAENCLKWGVGGINIDGCRVGITPTDARKIQEQVKGFNNTQSIGGNGKYCGGEVIDRGQYNATLGRFPANIIHDGSQEVLNLFPSPHGAGKSRSASDGTHRGFHDGVTNFSGSPAMRFGDSGSAARFFYCAKASKSERNRWCERNNHPTVKPISLMEYLVKLVTREGQTVLDPFAGSGTTGIACKNLNREAILIEREAEYVDIAERRNS